ncbi:MAG: acyltransferase [Candidatus Binatia bacterium]
MGTVGRLRASSTYFPELESLRGIAILLVMYFHADGFVRMPTTNSRGIWPSPLAAFVLAGHTGVSLFFILSAFLLSMPFLAQAEGGKPVARGTFYCRRALRILPLYWTVVVVGMAITAQRPADLLRALPYLAFLNSVPNWVAPVYPYTTVLWSLATEAQFYVLLPLLPLLFGSPRRRRVGVAVLLVYAVAYAAFLAGRVEPWRPEAAFFLRGSVFGRGPLFLFGILAAWIHRRYGARIRSWRGWRPGLADGALIGCVLGLGCLLRELVFFGYKPWDQPPWYGWHLIEGVLWSAIVLLMLDAPLRLRPLLVNPVLARFGVLSYSIYLLHVPVWDVTLRAVRTVYHSRVGWSPLMAGWVTGASVVLLLLSMLTYRFIEQPFLVRKARLDT